VQKWLGFVSGHFFTWIGITLYNAGDGSQTSIYKQEGNAYHCMSLPTGIAFSEMEIGQIHLVYMMPTIMEELLYWLRFVVK
jgi:hypothetical protein